MKMVRTPASFSHPREDQSYSDSEAEIDVPEMPAQEPPGHISFSYPWVYEDEADRLCFKGEREDYCMVARPVSRKEREADPKARAAVDKE